MEFNDVLAAYLAWDYDAVMGSFAVEGSWPTSPPPAGGPARRLLDAAAPIGEHAIWSPRPNATLAKLGLAFAPAYVWGRAAALGEPPAELVVSAFAVFAPRLLTPVYEHGRRQCGRAGLLAAREDATVESLSTLLAGADVGRVVATLRRGLDAADGTGRALFSGLRSLPWPTSEVGQLWRACDLLREHRADSHTIAWLAAGLGPVAANLLTELWHDLPLGIYTSMRRGWSEDDIAAAVADLTERGLVADGALTPAGRRFRDGIEDTTDALQQAVVDAIGDDLEPTARALRAWSAAVVEAGAFPPGAFAGA